MGVEAVRKRHHPSHRGCVEQFDAAPTTPGRFDAIAVPAARSVGHLAAAAALALRQEAVLVVLCSGPVRAVDVESFLRRSRESPAAIAVDVTAELEAKVLPFRTSRLARDVGGMASDIAAKRNLALLIARRAGWGNLLFLDDDVRGFTDADVARARCAVDRFEAAGWAFTDRSGAGGSTADNSVVCHAHRLAGGLEQDTFIGGGAMAVRISDVATPYFPRVYNEDWLFLFDLLMADSVALLGELRQIPYDPFRSPERARVQEIGDVLAEGLFRILHVDRGERSAAVREAESAGYWRVVVAHRREFIADIRARLHGSFGGSPAEHLSRLGALRSLEAAEAQLTEGLPRLLAVWVREWRLDLHHWRERWHDLAVGSTWLDAAHGTGIAHRTRTVEPRRPARLTPRGPERATALRPAASGSG